MQQLPKEMLTYIEKKHYHVGKKVADVSFTLHPETFFQHNNISFGLFLSCRKYF